MGESVMYSSEASTCPVGARARGLPVSGAKAVLVARLQDADKSGHGGGDEGSDDEEEGQEEEDEDDEEDDEDEDEEGDDE